MKIIIDTNLWISFLIGHQTNIVRRILIDTQFSVYVCKQLIEEIRDVAGRNKIRRYFSSNDLEDLMSIINSFCIFVNIDHQAKSPIRDPKDLYLLSLAETINADYIISGDADLTDLKKHHNTRIIKMSEFKQILSLFMGGRV